LFQLRCPKGAYLVNNPVLDPVRTPPSTASYRSWVHSCRLDKDILPLSFDFRAAAASSAALHLAISSSFIPSCHAPVGSTVTNAPPNASPSAPPPSWLEVAWEGGGGSSGSADSRARRSLSLRSPSTFLWFSLILACSRFVEPLLLYGTGVMLLWLA
jgi:hypothetical protein